MFPESFLLVNTGLCWKSGINPALSQDPSVACRAADSAAFAKTVRRRNTRTTRLSRRSRGAGVSETHSAETCCCRFPHLGQNNKKHGISPQICHTVTEHRHVLRVCGGESLHERKLTSASDPSCRFLLPSTCRLIVRLENNGEAPQLSGVAPVDVRNQCQGNSPSTRVDGRT